MQLDQTATEQFSYFHNNMIGTGPGLDILASSAKSLPLPDVTESWPIHRLLHKCYVPFYDLVSGWIPGLKGQRQTAFY